MARKNPFANLMDDAASAEDAPALDYTVKGASRSILSSIDELAERADKLLEGETIVELDPSLIDVSFVKDRLGEDDKEYQELLEAIRDRGQDSPILVRPHPKAPGRYMVVYGHRRLKVAGTLGTKVRAVVKALNDEDHVLAQGQENSARANLSFIEKAVFANRLSRLQFDGDNGTVLKALSIDRATLSKMLSVAGMPLDILEAIGPAKSIGRDRWYQLKILLEKPSNIDKASAFVLENEFVELSSDERFNLLFGYLKSGKKRAAPTAAKKAKSWSPEDRAVAIDMKTNGKNYTLELKAKGDNAVKFGEFIAENLEQLYDAYKAQVQDEA